VSLAWDPSASEGVAGYKVYYGNASLTYNSSQTIVDQPTCTVTGLSDGSTYYFAVTALDTTGKESGFSNEVSITVGVIPPLDTTPPVISSVAASDITISGATISWTTNEAATSRVQYGTTTNYGGTTSIDSLMQTLHLQELSGLAPGTMYHYQVLSMDEEGNMAVSGDYVFTTSTPVDATPPVISLVAASDITISGATISWTTNEAATSQVEYGTTTEYGNISTINSSMQRSHAQTLSGLSIDTLYHYRVRSGDTAGNIAFSEDFTFRTLSDTTPPTIGSVTVSERTGTEATITWITDEPSDTQIEYGTTSEYGGVTTLDSPLTTSHIQALTGLSPDTGFHFRVLSRDLAGNLAISQDYSFTTLKIVSTLAMPLFSDSPVSPNNELYAGVAITNMSSSAETVRFSAFDEDGNIISGNNITNPAVRSLHAGEQISLVDVEIFGTSLNDLQQSGWIEISSTTDKVQGFSMMFDGQKQLMDAVRLAWEPVRDFVFTDLEPTGKTRINLINRNAQACSVKIDLVMANGDVRSSVTETIKDHSVLIEELYADIFAGIAPDTTDYIRISTSDGIIPFLLMQHETVDISLTYGQDISAAWTNAFIPRYIYDRDNQTTLSIVNMDSTAGQASIRLVGKDGVQIGLTRDIQIDAYGKLTIDSQEFFLDTSYAEVQNSDVPGGGNGKSGHKPPGKPDKTAQDTISPSLEIEGYVEIISDGIRLVGSASYLGPKKLKFITTQPLVSDLYRDVVLSHVASNDLYFTNLAIVNPSSNGASVTLDLYNSEGVLIDSAIVSLPPSHQLFNSLAEYFSALQGTSQTGGYVILSSDVPIAVSSFFGTNNQSALSTLPTQGIELSAPLTN